VTGTVLAKVAAVTGGAVMTTKSVLLPILIAALLVVSLGGVMLMMNFRNLPSGRSGAAPTRDPEFATESPAAVNTTFTAPRASHDEFSGTATPETRSALRVRLDQFKQWWFAKEKEGMGEDPGRNRHDKELWEQVSGLRALIMADPEEFLAFLMDPENEGLLMDLTQMNPLTQADRPYVDQIRPYADLPNALRAGLFDLLQSGTVRQRVATFRLLSGFADVPEAVKGVYLVSIDDAHPDVQAFATRAIGLTVPVTPALLSKLTALGTGSESAAVRQAVVAIMAMTPGAASETFLLNRVELVTDCAELYSVIFSLERRYANRGGDPIQEEALGRVLAAVAARGYDVRVFRFFPLATNLSGGRLKPILLQIMGQTKDDEYRGRLRKAVEMIDQGSSARDDLMKILDPPK
jgi:hypothetical protein